MRRIIKNLCVFFVVVGVTLFAGVHMYMVYMLDVSIAPLRPTSQGDIHLVSYADGPDVFRQNQNFQTLSAINRGVDHVHMYQRKHLSAEFCKKHEKILSEKKGAGYWLWKPYVILETLKHVPEGAIVIYLDSGINLLSHVQIFIDRLKDNDMLLVSWNPLPEQESVSTIGSKEILNAMGCVSEACMASPHVWAAIGVYRNTARTRVFVQKWLEACENDEWLRSGTNDETILSALAAQEESGIGHIKTGEILGVNICWNHRHPEASSKSLLPYISREMRSIIRKMYWGWSYSFVCVRDWWAARCLNHASVH